MKTDAMKTDTVKIGIMSVAHLHADAYIGNLRAIPNVTVVGIADDNAARGDSFAQQFETTRFASYEALLAEQPDGVLVCSENANHRPLVEMAAKAGVHVLSEKPLATNMDDAAAIVAVCAQANVHLMTAFPMRFSAPLLQVKQSLDAGEIGQVFALNTTNQGKIPKDIRAWFVDKSLAGGGALMDHIVHVADVLSWWFDSDVVEVYAQSNRILHADAVEVETGGLVMLTFANGIFATIDCSWSKPLNYPTWGGLRIDLISDGGLTQVDAFSQNLLMHQQSPAAHYWQPWGSDANQAMIDEFVAAVRTDRSPSVTGVDGLRAQAIVDAAYRSAETNLPVRLQSI